MYVILEKVPARAQVIVRVQQLLTPPLLLQGVAHQVIVMIHQYVRLPVGIGTAVDVGVHRKQRLQQPQPVLPINTGTEPLV